MNRAELLEKRNLYLTKICKSGTDKRQQEALPWAKNVVATGIGMKMTGGRVIHKLCLVVFVRKKVSATYLGEYDVKRCFNDDERDDSDVVEVGSFQSIAGAHARPRPPFKNSLKKFVNIGADLSMASSTDHATLCTFVHKRGWPRDGTYFLSAQHGIDGHQGLFHLVTSGGDVIGQIERESSLFPGVCPCNGLCPDDPAYNHQLDAVVCRLKDSLPRFDLPGGGRLDTSPGDPHNYLNCEVRKASGNITTGYVHCADICATVDYPSETACLPGQFLIRHETGDGSVFATPGDSGSLIVAAAPVGDTHRHTALGMLIAVGDPVSLLGENEADINFSIATPISRILDEFDLSLTVG